MVEQGAVERWVFAHPMAIDDWEKVKAFARAHDAEDAEREALVARLVAALETSARVYHSLVHGKGDWRQCEFESCLADSAAIAAAREA